ncbi:MAG: aldo/keto reductase [Desulfatibacillaceae bacterium]
MRKRNLGSTDIKITPIIMGTWQAGKTMWTGIEDKKSIKAMRNAFVAGITAFDTAEVYGEGHSERMLGEALKDIREKVVFMTKVFSNHLEKDQVLAACDRSLENLRTDWIDLYQVHWPPGSFGHKKVPVRETFEALNQLREEGKIKAVGVSNFSLDQLKEARKYADIASVQPPYSLFWRHIEKDLQPYCVDNNISILAYSPMAQGILTGKFGPDHKFEKGDHRAANKLFQPSVFARVQEALDRLRPIAERHGVTLGQLALAWVCAQPNTCAIAGARSADQIMESAKASLVRLSEEDMDEMDEISRTVMAEVDDSSTVMWKWG